MVNFASWAIPFLSGLYLPADASVPDSSIKDRICVIQPVVPQTEEAFDAG